MLPHSLSKSTISVDKPFCMDPDTADHDEDTINGYFRNENDMILEGEEEYDVLNDETFGSSVTDFSKEDEEDLPLLPWDDYDQHNDETFGEEINYDWETEHEKMVGVLEYKVEGEVSKPGLTKKTFIPYASTSKPNNVNINGYHEGDRQLQISDSYEAQLIKSLRNKSSPTDNITNAVDGKELDHFGCIETLTNNKCSKFLKQDKWCNKYGDSSFYGSNSDQNVPFSHGYSLFSSGTNLLQNAGINIPSVSSASLGVNTVDNIEKRLEDMKLQPNSSSSISNVGHLEKQWITDASSLDCFRAYNNSFFVNSNCTGNNTNLSNALPLQSTLSIGSSMDPFSSQDASRNDSSYAVGGPRQNMMFSTASNTNQRFPLNGDFNSHSFFGSVNPAAIRLSPHFEPTAIPVPVMAESGIIMCNNTVFQNLPNFAEVNTAVSPLVNNMLTRTKTLPTLDPSVIMSDMSSRIVNGSLLIENSITKSIVPKMNINVFSAPPPGLTIDPSKLRHIQNTAAVLQARHQGTSSLSLQPLQVLNGIDPSEQQQKIMKLQKQDSLSNTDEYAGLMTEREKYWLAGVQLLQINGMDPYKDDYYFTNYQARRKGNRTKTQNNSNNNKWKYEHTKDYCPLQFENSLGKVQIGSVVAPRKVIDNDVFDGSPKHNGMLNDSLHEDPIANTSNRKRKAIMLHIENMYGKIMALESLHINSTNNKIDPAIIKNEFGSIVFCLKEEILGLKDDFKIVMSIKKGKRLVLRFLSYCENPDDVWYQIFEILDRIMRGDQEHSILLCYLPYFRTWMVTADLAKLNRIAEYFKKNIIFFLKDKFSVSVIANMIEHAEERYLYSNEECQNKWMEFILMLSESVNKSDNIQKPVVLVKPQVLRSHLLRCKNLENGYMSDLLKIFSNSARK